MIRPPRPARRHRARRASLLCALPPRLRGGKTPLPPLAHTQCLSPDPGPGSLTFPRASSPPDRAMPSRGCYNAQRICLLISTRPRVTASRLVRRHHGYIYMASMDHGDATEPAGNSRAVFAARSSRSLPGRSPACGLLDHSDAIVPRPWWRADAPVAVCLRATPFTAVLSLHALCV